MTFNVLLMYIVHMSQTALTIKIDSQVKKEAQELAKRLGLSLSAIIENNLKTTVRERQVVFKDELIPNAKFARQLRRIERDVKEGKNLSGPFNSYEELERHLNEL